MNWQKQPFRLEPAIELLNISILLTPLQIPGILIWYNREAISAVNCGRMQDVTKRNVPGVTERMWIV